MAHSTAVIMPNYNHARWLPRAVTAIVRQSLRPTRLVIIDDGSTDNSVEVIRKFQQTFPLIQLIRHDRNLGAEAAVRTGIESLTEDYVLFAAADDFILPGLIERATSALESHPDAAFFCSGVALVDKRDKVIGFRPIARPRLTAGYVSPAEMMRAIRTSDNWFVGNSIVYRRQHLAEIGYFDNRLGTLQDALATRLLAARHGFCFDPRVLATWRLVGENQSIRSSLSIEENQRLLHLADEWIMHRLPEEFRLQYAELFARRLRFNLARLRLVWRDGQIKTNEIAELLKLTPRKRRLLQLANHFPLIAPGLILALVSLWTKPYSISSVTAAVWRKISSDYLRARKVGKLISSYRFSELDRCLKAH